MMTFSRRANNRPDAPPFPSPCRVFRTVMPAVPIVAVRVAWGVIAAWRQASRPAERGLSLHEP